MIRGFVHICRRFRGGAGTHGKWCSRFARTLLPALAALLATAAGHAQTAPPATTVTPATGGQIPVASGMVSVHDRQAGPIPLTMAEVAHPFGKAPPVGVHPRVLFSPDDLPRIRKELQETACGRRVYAAIKGWAGNASGGEAKPLGKVWLGLVAGDMNALDCAASEWWRANISVAVGLEAFVCLIEDSAERSRRAGTALTTLAKILNGRTIAFGAAKSNPDVDFGLAYDFLYSTMTPEQRATVRQAIAASTNGKRSHGMDMEPERRTYNFMSHGMGLVVETLCIEGEEGYDPEIYPKSVEVLRDFLTYGVYPHGAPREGMHYYNFGMGSGGAMAMVAFARRGDVLFGHPHWQATQNWYLHDMEPFGYAFSMHCDTPNDNGGLLDNYVVMKRVWPDNPVLDFVWRGRVKDDYSGVSYRGDFLLAAIFPSDWNGGATGERPPGLDQWGADAGQKPDVKPLAPWNPAALGQPLSFLDPDRGLLMTRSEWDRNALALHFECKLDERGPSHSHANRNDFTLSALGRRWFIDRGFGISESKHHNMILIDGRGEGFFCGSGQMVAYLDTPTVTLICGDARNAYARRYGFANRLENPENKEFAWTPRPDNADIITAEDNPVAKAFRTVLLLRGAQPYVLIVDDIKKDDQVRLYESLLQTPDDLAALTIKGGDAILGVPGTEATTAKTGKTAATAPDTKAAPATADPAAAAPRLLVRVLQAEASGGNRLADAGELIRFETYNLRRSPNTGSDKDAGLGRRLVISRYATEPQFKLLLFPYRLGQTPPVSQWNADHSALTITGNGIKDEFTFAPTADGRTGYTLLRGGGMFASSGLKQSPAGAGTFAFAFAGEAANLGYDNGKLYISGRGWKKLTFRGGAVSTVMSDGSAGAAVPVPTGEFEVMEK